MSFRYKSAWLSLVSMVLVYGWYFGGLIAAGHRATGAGTMAGLTVTIVLLAIVQIVGHIVIAVVTPGWSGKLDEREWAFELKATNVGYYALIAGLFGMVPLIGSAGSVYSFANAVVLMVVAAECARQVVFLTQFHKAA